MILKIARRLTFPLLALNICLATIVPTAMAEPSKTPEPAAVKGKEQPPHHEASGKPSLEAQKPATSSHPEQEALAKINPALRTQLETLGEAMQLEAKGISDEILDHQEEALKDIAMLWQAAVERSDSIQFALQKLSRQDATGKPVENDGMTKRILQSATRLTGVAGTMLTASPAAMIGTGMLEDMLLSDPTSSALQRVTDADMVILAKEVETLQARVIEQYYHYRHAEERWRLAQEAAQTLSRYYDKAGKDLDASMETVLSSLYESAKQDEAEAKQTYVSARSQLALLTGPTALQAMESARQSQQASTQSN